jgi:tetratricopeptide (TPR) repeat protein
MEPAMLAVILSGALLATAPQPVPARSAAAARPPQPASAAEAYFEFLNGRRLEGEGDIEGAVAAYRRAAAADPQGAEVRAELAGLYARQNDTDLAIEAAEEALRIDPDSAEAHAVLGSIYAGRLQQDASGAPQAGADATRAIEHLQKASGARRYDLGLQLTLGRLYVAARDYPRAIDVLGGLVEREPGIAEASWWLAQAYAGAGRRTEAIAALEEAVAVEPRFYRGLLMLAELYEQERQWPRAASAYARAADQNPRSAELRVRQASALLAGGQTREARDVLERVAETNPTNGSVLYLLSDAQRTLKDFEAARATAQRLVALEPRGLRGPYALALVEEERHDVRSVISTLEPVAGRPATSVADTAHLGPVLIRLAYAYQELGEFDKAIATFERAQAVVGDAASTQPLLAQAYVAAGQHDRALALLRPARQARPDDERLLRVEAEALRSSGKADEAVALLAASRERFADDLDFQLGYATLLSQAGRPGEALAAFDAIEARFPGEPEVPFQRGAALERADRFDEAEAAFRETLKRDPLHAQALNYLGYMLAERGQRLYEAVVLVERALEIDPGNPSYLDSLGWAWFKRGNRDQARQHLTAAAERLPRNSVVQDHLGDLLLASGDPSGAVEAWRRSLSGDGEDIDRPAIQRKIDAATRRKTR